MKTGIQKIALSSIILITVLACDIPAISSYASVPTLDPAGLSTLVAGTSAAMETQTIQAGSTLNKSSFPSTATATPAEITISPTPKLAFSAYGTALDQQADGTTLFIDQQGKYQFMIPAGWTAFRINQSEYFKILGLPVSSKPIVKNNMTSTQNLDPNIFRLFAYDLRDDHLQSNTLTNIDVTWAKNFSTINDVISQTQKNYSKLFSSSQILSSTLETNPSNVEIGKVDFDLKTKIQNVQYVDYERQLIFKVQQGIIVMRLDTTYELKDAILPEFDQTKESIQLIAP